MLKSVVKKAVTMSATKKPFTLPKGFLKGPAPAIKVSKIDFANSTIPEYNDLWAVVLDDVMTPEECKALVNAAEATTDGKWERAMINVGNGKQALYEDTRNCGRIIWDDKEIVAKLWARVESTVPELQYLENWPKVTGIGPTKRKETWRMTRLNERMRFLKYSSGEYFRPHCDGTYETPDFKERSYFTLHLYLNDASSDPKGQSLQGGSTTFHAYDMKRRIDVEPKIGRVLLFQHKFLLHSGDDVTQGTKLTMRTDVMF
ncbi:oxidoreductase domain-containing protein, partial [Mytilinidion resinicola]